MPWNVTIAIESTVKSTWTKVSSFLMIIIASTWTIYSERSQSWRSYTVRNYQCIQSRSSGQQRISTILWIGATRRPRPRTLTLSKQCLVSTAWRLKLIKAKTKTIITCLKVRARQMIPSWKLQTNQVSLQITCLLLRRKIIPHSRIWNSCIYQKSKTTVTVPTSANWIDRRVRMEIWARLFKLMTWYLGSAASTINGDRRRISSRRRKSLRRISWRWLVMSSSQCRRSFGGKERRMWAISATIGSSRSVTDSMAWSIFLIFSSLNSLASAKWRPNSTITSP